MKTKQALVAAALLAMLSACASTGTRVTASTDDYKSMARSQQWWCSSVKAGCDCQVDGQPATCSLVAMCLNAGSCKQQ